MLAGLLGGGILRADPEAMREWQEIQGAFRPPDDFRMKARVGGVAGEGRAAACQLAARSSVPAVTSGGDELP